jgi:hypothetical protein
MKTIKLYSIGLAATMIFTFSEQSFAQMANFYSSSGYSNFVNTMLSNSIWKSSMEKYTKEYKPGSGVSKPGSPSKSSPEVVPAYRQYPAVRFKPTGTRLTLQQYLDVVQISAEDKAELKELILKIFKEFETEAAAKGLPNDWALAYVSFVGLNSHVYNGQKEKPIVYLEQNVGLRDAVAEQATYDGIFNNVTDQQKQELYELLILLGGLTYHFYEKALKENNVEEIESCKRSAANNLELIGIKPQ